MTSACRRVGFTTLAAEPPPTHRTRTEPSTDAARDTARSGPQRGAGSVRLVFALFDSDDVSYPEFNYSQQVQQSLLKALPVSLAEQDEGSADDDVDAIVERLEKKYGSKPKVKDRIQDLIDIGYGYEEDSFIDNSEAYDEFVPASITTTLGGFYVNSGPLQFRQASDTDDDVDAAAGEKTPPKATKKRKLRLGPYKPREKKVCREDGEPVGGKGQRSRKPPETRASDILKKKKRRHSAGPLDVASMLRRFEREKAKRQQLEKQQQQSIGGAAVKAALCPRDPAGDRASGSSDPLVSLIGSTDDHALIQAANAVDLDIDLESLLRASEAPLPPRPLPPLDPGAPAFPAPSAECSSDCGWERPEAEPACLLIHAPLPQQHRRGPPLQGVPPLESCPPLQGVPPLERGPPLQGVPPLEGIPAGLNRSLQQLDLAALTTDGESRVKFFTPHTNSVLLDVELQCRALGAPVRSRVYTHLASFLPCSRETLLKRVKKLAHLHAEQRPRAEDPVHGLREAIGRAMPEQIAYFHQNCLVYKQVKATRAAAEEKEGGAAAGVDPEERSGSRGVPRKLFTWNQEVRECLRRVLADKMEMLRAEQTEAAQQEERLKAFLDSEVKPLWPKGWMASRALMSESRKMLNLVTPSSLFKRSRPKKKQSPVACCGLLQASQPLGGASGPAGGAGGAASGWEADCDGASAHGSRAPPQAEHPLDGASSMGSPLVLLADQALEAPPGYGSQRWSAAVDIARVPLPPGAGGFPLQGVCQVVVPEPLELGGLAGPSQANTMIQ